jgi:hypothetical protein
LVEKHEREKTQKAGISKTIRGRQAAALDARGAAMGSLGLACFAVVVWKLAPVWNSGLTLLAATVMWLALSILIWRFRKYLRLKSR